MNNILINKKSRQLVHILYSARPEIDLENSKRLGKGGGGAILEWKKSICDPKHFFAVERGGGKEGKAVFRYFWKQAASNIVVKMFLLTRNCTL